jgi:hypothetical protein
MKLALAIGVLVGWGALIGAGLVLAVQGKPWLLITSVLAYGLAFVRVGCATH